MDYTYTYIIRNKDFNESRIFQSKNVFVDSLIDIFDSFDDYMSFMDFCGWSEEHNIYIDCFY